MSTSNKGPGVDSRLQNLTNALYLDSNDDVVVRTGFAGNIVISGNVNIPGVVEVESSHDHPVHTHTDELGNIDLSNTWMPVQGNVVVSGGNITVQQGTTPWVTTGNANVTVIGNIAGITTLPAITGDVGVSGNVSITQLPAITGNVDITRMPGITGNVGVSGNVSITQLPALGNVSITQMPTITGNVGVSGNVDITRLPAVTGNVHVYGNVDVDHLPNVTIGQMPAVTITGNVTTVSNPGDFTYVKYIDETNTQLDAVGRLRVSPPTQNFWYVPSIDKDGDLRYIESFTGTGATSVFVQNIASILMTSGSDANGKSIRISRRRHKLRPGVSVQWQASCSFNGVTTNSVKRVGMFTNYNGFFFQVDTDLKFVARRRLIDGTLIEDSFNRDSWTFDKLDGTGPSGLNLDPTTTIVDFALGSYVSKTAKVISATETHYNVVFNTATECPFRLGTKATITGFNSAGYNSLGMIVAKTANTVTFYYPLDPGSFTNGTCTMTQTGLHHKYTWWVDFQGDRTTRLRFGIDTEEGPQVCHIVDYTGQLGTHWSNAPAMSDRAEIYNTGAVTVRPTMTWAATSINIEAELQLNPGFGVAHAQTSVNFSKTGDVGNQYAILGIGLRAGEPYQRADLQIQRVQFTDLGNLNPQNAAIFEWSLVLNPTVSAVPSPVDIGKATRYWDYASGTTITGGTYLTGGYFQGTQQMEVQNALNFLNLGSNIEYTDADRVVLVAKMLVGGSSNSQMRATMNFIEAL